MVLYYWVALNIAVFQLWLCNQHQSQACPNNWSRLNTRSGSRNEKSKPNVVVFLETSWHCCICTPSELSATINGECVPCDCCSALGYTLWCFLSHSFWGAYMWRMSLQFVTLSMSRERKFVLSELCMILWCVLVCACSSGIVYVYGTLVAVQYVQWSNGSELPTTLLSLCRKFDNAVLSIFQRSKQAATWHLKPATSIPCCSLACTNLSMF